MLKLEYMASLREVIKERILKCANIQELSQNPNDNRFTFINDIEVIREQALDEYKVWFVGNSNELQNYYTNREISGNAQESIYNRNKPNYFWGIAVGEQAFKKVHSGVPKAIIDTICNVLGYPKIEVEGNPEIVEELKKDKFRQKLTQIGRPLTCVEADGAYKVNINGKKLSVEFVEGKDVDFAVGFGGELKGVIFRSYYKYKNKDYVLFEIRRIGKAIPKNETEAVEGSIIEFELYRLDKGNSVYRCEFEEVPELASLRDKFLILPNVKRILAVPSRYFYNVDNKERGRSLFEGKLDVFDDIDQCLSQASQTDRVSTPVEYYPVDLLERDKFGNTQLPAVYNRQFIKKEVMPNGDGNSDNAIQSTQPQLNFQQYIDRYHSLIDIALIGVLSPATMGFDVSRKDNAEAQREKEKITLYTRDNMMDAETDIIKDIIEIWFILDEYLKTGSVSLVEKKHNISVKYDDYASPTFDNLVQTLLPLFTNGAMSTKEFVNRLYGENMSETDKLNEIAELEKKKQEDNLQFGDIETELDMSKNGENSLIEKQNAVK